MSSILIALLLPFTLGSFAPAQEARPEVGDEVARLNASVVQLFNEGKFDEGGKQARRALSLAEEGLGDRHELTAVARNNLARLYAVTGNHTAAEKHYRKALAVFVELRGADSLEAAAVHESLGQLELYGKRDPGRALKSYRRALDIREKVLGAEHDEVMRAARNVLRVYEVTQDWSEAEPLLKRMAEVREKALAPGDPRLVSALASYGCFLRQSKRTAEAESLDERAFAALAGAGGDRPVPLPSAAVLCRASKVPLPDYADSFAKGVVSAGEVEVEVEVDESGRVTSARAVSGPAIFRGVSADAATKSRFAPLVLKGKPLKFKTVLTYAFSGQKGYSSPGVGVY